MKLPESYKLVKPSVVAICSRYPETPDFATTGVFPTIVGTGFIIDERGLILTNQHVIDAIHELTPKGASPYDTAFVVLFQQAQDETVRLSPLKILGFTIMPSAHTQTGQFDRTPPDIALIAVGVHGLPACNVRLEYGGIIEGLQIGTAGFPMGSSGLIDPEDGLIRQLSPILQSGIISAVQPHACAKPLSFTIDIHLQGGASGSPVFDADTGEVLGIGTGYTSQIRSHLVKDKRGAVLENGKDNPYSVNLNIPATVSTITPTFVISRQLPALVKEYEQRNEGETISLTDFNESQQTVDLSF